MDLNTVYTIHFKRKRNDVFVVKIVMYSICCHVRECNGGRKKKEMTYTSVFLPIVSLLKNKKRGKRYRRRA